MPSFHEQPSQIGELLNAVKSPEADVHEARMRGILGLLLIDPVDRPGDPFFHAQQPQVGEPPETEYQRVVLLADKILEKWYDGELKLTSITPLTTSVIEEREVYTALSLLYLFGAPEDLHVGPIRPERFAAIQERSLPLYINRQLQIIGRNLNLPNLSGDDLISIKADFNALPIESLDIQQKSTINNQYKDVQRRIAELIFPGKENAQEILQRLDAISAYEDGMPSERFEEEFKKTWDVYLDAPKVVEVKQEFFPQFHSIMTRMAFIFSSDNVDQQHKIIGIMKDIDDQYEKKIKEQQQ